MPSKALLSIFLFLFLHEFVLKTKTEGDLVKIEIPGDVNEVIEHLSLAVDVMTKRVRL
jgi:hypothetical protein